VAAVQEAIAASGVIKGAQCGGVIMPHHGRNA